MSSGQIAYLPDGRLLLTWNLYGPRLFPSPDFMVRTRSRVLGPNGVLSEEFRLEQAVGNIVLPSGEQDGQAFPLIGYWNPFPGRIDPATYWRVSWFSTADGARTGGPYRLLPPSWGVVAAATVASRTLLVMGRNDPEQPCCLAVNTNGTCCASGEVDGVAARATAPTRAGRDLEGLVDGAALGATLLGARRRDELAPAATALEITRISAGFAYALLVYFGRADAPDPAVTRAAWATTPVRVAGLLIAARGQRRAGSTILAAGSLLGLAAVARAVAQHE